MSDFARPLDPFQFGIFYNVTGLKGLVQSNVDVLVDCCGYQKPAVVPIVGRKVGAATA